MISWALWQSRAGYLFGIPWHVLLLWPHVHAITFGQDGKARIDVHVYELIIYANGVQRLIPLPKLKQVI